MAKPIPRGACLRQQRIVCGKRGCKSDPHGPYWYAFWKDDRGRSRSAYVGKELPAFLRNQGHLPHPYSRTIYALTGQPDSPVERDEPRRAAKPAARYSAAAIAASMKTPSSSTPQPHPSTLVGARAPAGRERARVERARVVLRSPTSPHLGEVKYDQGGEVLGIDWIPPARWKGKKPELTDEAEWMRSPEARAWRRRVAASSRSTPAAKKPAPAVERDDAATLRRRRAPGSPPLRTEYGPPKRRK